QTTPPRPTRWKAPWLFRRSFPRRSPHEFTLPLLELQHFTLRLACALLYTDVCAKGKSRARLVENVDGWQQWQWRCWFEHHRAASLARPDSNIGVAAAPGRRLLQGGIPFSHLCHHGRACTQFRYIYLLPAGGRRLLGLASHRRGRSLVLSFRRGGEAACIAGRREPAQLPPG